VAGVAVLYLQGNTGASPASVRDAIVDTSTTGVLSSIGSGSPDRLLYAPLSGGGTTPPPPTGCTLFATPFPLWLMMSQPTLRIARTLASRPP